LQRRSLLAAATTAALLTSARAQRSDVFPTRPVTLVVPFAVGGPTDAVARALAEALRPALGVPIVVDNRAGAGGALANDFVARSAPDGHTLLLAGSSLTINPAVTRSVLDPVHDLAAVSQVLTLEIFLVARAELPPRTLPQLVEYARARPGQLSFGSSGNGSVTHMQMELLKALTGIHLVHIPYRGNAPALQDLLGGQIDLLFDSLATSGPHIRSGQLRPLAVAAPARSRHLPEVPTVVEAGVAGYEASAWSGILVAPKTPPALIQRLNRDIVAAVQDAGFQQRLDAIGGVAAGSTPAEYAKRIGRETAKWARLVKDRGIKAE